METIEYTFSDSSRSPRIIFSLRICSDLFFCAQYVSRNHSHQDKLPSTNFLLPLEIDRVGDAIRPMHSSVHDNSTARGVSGRGWGKEKRRKEDATSVGKTEERRGRKRRRRRNEARRRAARNAIPRRRKVYRGHYFLQYFNVKSSGFLEPSYRFLQEEPSVRSRPGGRKRDGCSGWEREGWQGRAGPRGGSSSARSFSCDAIFERRAASLRRGGGSRTIAPPPLRFLLFPRCSSIPSSLLIVLSFTLSLSLTLFLSVSFSLLSFARPAILLFLFHRGESFATIYIYIYTYPNGIRHSLDSEPIQ